MKDPSPMTGKDLKWNKMLKKLEEGEAIPELGLEALTKRRISLPTPIEASTIQERNTNLPKIKTRKKSLQPIDSDSDSLDPENIN